MIRRVLTQASSYSTDALQVRISSIFATSIPFVFHSPIRPFSIPCQGTWSGAYTTCLSLRFMPIVTQPTIYTGNSTIPSAFACQHPYSHLFIYQTSQSQNMDSLSPHPSSTDLDLTNTAGNPTIMPFLSLLAPHFSGPDHQDLQRYPTTHTFGERREETLYEHRSLGPQPSLCHTSCR